MTKPDETNTFSAQPGLTVSAELNEGRKPFFRLPLPFDRGSVRWVRKIWLLPRAFKELAGRLIAAELARVPYALGHASQDSALLMSNFGETSKETRNVFLLYLSVSVYALLTVFIVPDSVFYAANANVELPILNFKIQASRFFVAVPLLVLALFTYLQIYLGHLERLYRAFVVPNAADRVYPWVFALSRREGPGGLLTRFFFGSLIWLFPICISVACWWRLLVVRSTFSDWSAGSQLPPASLGAWISVASILLSAAWYIPRRLVNGALGLRKPLAGSSLVVLLAMGVLAIMTLSVQWELIRYRRPAALTLSVLSEPPNPPRKHAVGPRLPGVRLQQARLEGAYLANALLPHAWLEDAYCAGADLSGASLESSHANHIVLAGANLSNAKLDGSLLDWVDARNVDLESATAIGIVARVATFVKARARNADFYIASMQGSSFRGAHLERASFRGANLRGVTFEGAHLEGADFGDASLEGADFTGAYVAGMRIEGAIITGALFESTTGHESLTKTHPSSAGFVCGADVARILGTVARPRQQCLCLQGAYMWEAKSAVNRVDGRWQTIDREFEQRLFKLLEARNVCGW